MLEVAGSAALSPGTSRQASLPDDDAWLAALIDRSALLPQPVLRRHWRRVVPWLSTAARYELAAVLLETEHALLCD
jgi:hypothetical protein